MRDSPLPTDRHTDDPNDSSVGRTLPDNTRAGIGFISLQMLVVLGIALIVLSRYISPTPHFDEFYHVLAAQSLLDDGTLRVNEGGGDYTRARAFTYAVAGCYHLFGEGWASGRLPSMIACAFLVTAIFGWLARTVSTRAAWIGACLFMLAPDVITYASMVRFYTPHMLFVWLMGVCAYIFVTAKLSINSRIAVVVLGLGCTAMAAHLQTTTAIALLVITAWVGTEFAGWLVRCDRQQFKWALFWMLLVLVVAVPAVWFGLQYTGIMTHLQVKFQTPRLWSFRNKYEYRYFYRFFADSYPLLWAGFPFAVVVALATRRRPAWFCLVFFGLAFAIHSFMPFKTARYLSYAWPGFFALWAIALDGLLIWLMSQGRTVVTQCFSEALSAKRWIGGVLAVCLFTGLASAAWVSPEYKLSRKMLTGETLGPGERTDWAGAAKILRPIAEETRFVISSAPCQSVYYLGRLDVGLGVSQAAGRAEFEHDRIMGRPIITSVESLQRLMDEHPSGLIAVTSLHFGRRAFVPSETALFIEAHTQPIELPEGVGVRAFRWDPPPATLSDE